MAVEKQSGVGFLTPGSHLVFKIMNCSIWTCSKSLTPDSIQFINNYKFLLQPLLGPACLLFFLSPTTINEQLIVLDSVIVLYMKSFQRCCESSVINHVLQMTWV